MPQFPQSTSGLGHAGARSEVSTATIFGRVMFLVGVAIGFLALGTVVGKDLAPGTALICSLGGLGMLLIASFGGERFRVGTFAIGWLYALALLIGLGLGPAIAFFTANQPAVLTQAAGGTALTVVGMGALGFTLSKDLARWMRPLSILVLIAVGVSIVMLVVGAGGSPILSLIIYAVSALLILVNFNYLRKRASENDVVWLATGIFVSIVNIFISLLNLFSSR
ncbi:MAG: Bax inhibitor-1 family protein [Actinomycetota bacterium]|nr:Bax inhibitor-1 family protein [Actinomycetota bacterium]